MCMPLRCLYPCARHGEGTLSPPRGSQGQDPKQIEGSSPHTGARQPSSRLPLPAPWAGRPEGDCVLGVTEARGLRSSFRQAALSQGRPRPPSQRWGLLAILGVPCFVARPSNVCPTFTWPSPLVQTPPVSHWVWPTGRHCDLTSTNDVSSGPVFHTRVTSGSPGVRTSTRGGILLTPLLPSSSVWLLSEGIKSGLPDAAGSTSRRVAPGSGGVPPVTTVQGGDLGRAPWAGV